MSDDNKVFGDVQSFEVDRKTWYRGKGSAHSRLLNDEGQMCCLGFYAVAAGLPTDAIRRAACPSDVPRALWKTKLTSMDETVPLLPEARDTNAAHILMRMNDVEDVADEDREKRITDLFKQIGIDVKFVG
jgi:hypothetical protein